MFHTEPIHYISCAGGLILHGEFGAMFVDMAGEKHALPFGIPDGGKMVITNDKAYLVSDDAQGKSPSEEQAMLDYTGRLLAVSQVALTALSRTSTES